jgi:hypothetical protein
MRQAAVEEEAGAKLESQLSAVYTQSPIRDPRLFSGRTAALDLCRARLRVPGMSFAIYGDRGLGKTSFVNVLLSGRNVHWRTAESGMSFEALIGDVLRGLGEGWTPTERHTTDTATSKSGLNVPPAEVGIETSSEYGESYAPITPSLVDFDLVAEALARHQSEIDAIVVDEFHRLSMGAQRAVVQLMKVLADRGVSVSLVVVGIAEWGDELMSDREYRDYIGRNITPVPLPPMTRAELSDIVARRISDGVLIADDVAADLTWVASGHPALVHRVMFDAGVGWIASNTAALLAEVAGAAMSAAATATIQPIGLLLAPLVKMILLRRVELRTAKMRVGRSELTAALKQYVAAFEAEVLRKPGRLAKGTDPRAISILEAYLSEDEKFELDSLATRSGLATDVAQDLCRHELADFFAGRRGLRPVPGLRPYLRASHLLKHNGHEPSLSES